MVGTGPSGFTVINSLKSTDELWIIDGQTDFDDSALAIKSHLALKLKFGSSHTYVNPDSLGIVDQDSFQLPISYSRGGFGEIWGNGFTPYDYSEIDANADEDLRINVKKAMQELLEVIPFTHLPSELDERFGEVHKWSNSNHGNSLVINSIFKEFLENRPLFKIDGLVFGQPSLLLNSLKCKKCGLCLSGCPYGALFDPGEHINNMIYNKTLSSDRFIRGLVKSLRRLNVGVEVVYTEGDEEKSQTFDEVILCAGPLSTALILMNSDLLPEVFKIPDSQVFYSAFWSWKRIRLQKELQEVGQLVCYPRKLTRDDFQVSFYAPSETSRRRISQTVLPSLLKSFCIPRILSERIVPVIGFLPQSSSGEIQMNKTSNGVKISRVSNSISKSAVQNSLKQVAKSLRKSSLRKLPWSTRIPTPGSGFHIGASLPLGGAHIDKEGKLRVEPSIRVLDASILPTIPAGAHTFITMALIRHLVKSAE